MLYFLDCVCVCVCVCMCVCVCVCVMRDTIAAKNVKYPKALGSYVQVFGTEIQIGETPKGFFVTKSLKFLE